MNIYKPSFKHNGQMRQTSRWYVDFVDHRDMRQRFRAFESRGETERLGELLSELVKCRRARITPHDRWLHQLGDLPKDLQKRLLAIDLALPVWLAAPTDVLSTWATSFEDWLRTSKGRSGYRRNAIYCDITMTRIRNILSGARLRQWQDITPARIDTYLGSQNFTPATHNGYITSIRHFLRWCRRNGLATGDPLMDLSRVRNDLRETRRPIEAHEVAPLLEATLQRGRRFGIEAEDRVALYILALLTGLRRGELSHLTRECFHLDQGFVTLAAEHTKNHRPAVQPLPVAVLEPLKLYLKGKHPQERLWPHLSTKTARMLQGDAAAAGLAVVDDKGRELVFHSLRHSLRHWLCKAKVHESVVDNLLRHAPGTNDVGRRFYGHVDEDDRRHAIESLPVITWPVVSVKADKPSRKPISL